MAFTVKSIDEFYTDVDTNDRGQWSKLEKTKTYCEEFIGFGGENSLTLFRTGMSNATVHVMVVMTQCDGPSKVYEEEGPGGREIEISNRLIAKACDYPLVLPIR